MKRNGDVIIKSLIVDNIDKEEYYDNLPVSSYKINNYHSFICTIIISQSRNFRNII